MKNIAIVYHSGFGHTEVIAQHIYTGVQSVSGIESTIYKVDQVTNNPEQLNVYDSIINGMIWVNQIEPNMSPDYKPGKANVLNRMGSSLGLMAQSENDSPTTKW